MPARFRDGAGCRGPSGRTPALPCHRIGGCAGSPVPEVSFSPGVIWRWCAAGRSGPVVHGVREKPERDSFCRVRVGEGQRVNPPLLLSPCVAVVASLAERFVVLRLHVAAPDSRPSFFSSSGLQPSLVARAQARLSSRSASVSCSRKSVIRWRVLTRLVTDSMRESRSARAWLRVCSISMVALHSP